MARNDHFWMLTTFDGSAFKRSVFDDYEAASPEYIYASDMVNDGTLASAVLTEHSEAGDLCQAWRHPA
jgi:hypothetical protein